MSINIAVFISGSGTNLQAIIDACKTDKIDGQIKFVLSDKSDAYGLKRARKNDIKDIYLSKDEKQRDEKILSYLKDFKIDLIVLAGYLSIVNPKIIEKFNKKIINIHPSLIPKYCGKGYFGKKIHKTVLKNNDKVTGVTVHFVDEGIDTGEIIKQVKVKVKPNDTVDTLAKRVLEVEHNVLVDVIKSIARGEICEH
ncbi:MAG: phosphoribosylglycinamide formyltransferase [Bacillota bacterium]